MRDRDFRVNFRAVWFLVIANLSIFFLGSLARIQQWELPGSILTVGLILFFASWIIIAGDILTNKIANRSFWLISMFLVPPFAVLLYLIQRDKLLRLGEE
ncbi:hypothetical protein [Flavilitoribacter nigricans]|uniref:Uncharacterized protein n=1 Tax=Flavilitoribacter nigricans (strain ATCC 23147 / DSM 23189 / NBRC 102662 / NCIMB 1420 / SS-2) TaxID=1122177 RepID=A0A2D0NJ49_FLAN2|nr:hypothetical protein [Flavilitoribacter nigricans]PHN08468.1 hypothetical protein CRP01_00715 [Flavilitoribacter nigricans DSM 23189 = NBRC 102662]